MDQQLIHQAVQNPAPAPPESKLSKNGSEVEVFKRALDSVRISGTSEDVLKNALRYCMVLVGLRADNLPRNEETALLLNFIFRHYGQNTAAEIRLAFDMAVAGKLSVDATCYENFSVAFFAKIMNAYLKWASNFYEDNRLYNEVDLNGLPSSLTDWKELCELRYQDYLSGSYNTDFWPVELYDEFVKCEMMEENVYEDFLNESHQKILSDYRAKREGVDLKGNVVKQVGTALQKSLEIKAFGTGHKDVISKAKKMAVEFLYSKAKEQGFKNLFIKE